MIISSELATPSGLILILLVLALLCVVVLCVIRIRILQTKLISQKSSLQSFHVKAGNIAEQMAPFSSAFPWDPEGFKFLGNPLMEFNLKMTASSWWSSKPGKADLAKTNEGLRTW